MQISHQRPSLSTLPRPLNGPFVARCQEGGGVVVPTRGRNTNRPLGSALTVQAGLGKSRGQAWKDKESQPFWGQAAMSRSGWTLPGVRQRQTWCRSYFFSCALKFSPEKPVWLSNMKFGGHVCHELTRNKVSRCHCGTETVSLVWSGHMLNLKPPSSINMKFGRHVYDEKTHKKSEKAISEDTILTWFPNSYYRVILTISQGTSNTNLK